MTQCQCCGRKATWRLTNRGRGEVEGIDVVMLLCDGCKQRIEPHLRLAWEQERIEEAAG